MESENRKLNDELFSADPEENLRIENELLKLKLQAERGALFSENGESIPAEAEAAFLKNIQLFEEACEHTKETTVYELIGKPDWRKAAEVDPDALQAEVDSILGLMEAKNIFLHVEGQYSPAVIYEFLTGELFQQEVMPVCIPGFMQCFIYEEFHPNHTLSIEKKAKDFLDHWFRMEFNEYSIELASQFITADNLQFTRDEVLSRLSDCLACYQSFSNQVITNTATSFEWCKNPKMGLGIAEGMISYDAILENGETVPVSGPYKLYMSSDSDFWQIYYFEFPGFSW